MDARQRRDTAASQVHPWSSTWCTVTYLLCFDDAFLSHVLLPVGGRAGRYAQAGDAIARAVDFVLLCLALDLVVQVRRLVIERLGTLGNGPGYAATVARELAHVGVLNCTAFVLVASWAELGAAGAEGASAKKRVRRLVRLALCGGGGGIGGGGPGGAGGSFPTQSALRELSWHVLDRMTVDGGNGFFGAGAGDGEPVLVLDELVQVQTFTGERERNRVLDLFVDRVLFPDAEDDDNGSTLPLHGPADESRFARYAAQLLAASAPFRADGARVELRDAVRARLARYGFAVVGSPRGVSRMVHWPKISSADGAVTVFLVCPAAAAAGGDDGQVAAGEFVKDVFAALVQAEAGGGGVKAMVQVLKTYVDGSPDGALGVERFLESGRAPYFGYTEVPAAAAGGPLGRRELLLAVRELVVVGQDDAGAAWERLGLPVEGTPRVTPHTTDVVRRALGVAVKNKKRWSFVRWQQCDVAIFALFLAASGVLRCSRDEPPDGEGAKTTCSVRCGTAALPGAGWSSPRGDKAVCLFVCLFSFRFYPDVVFLLSSCSVSFMFVWSVAA